MAILDVNEIRRILPHRYPMLLVDRIVELEPDRIVGIKNVTANEPQFQGHFPGMPVFPGVFMVEAMAQTAAVMVGVGLGLADKKIGVYFMAIDGVKFRRKVVPGDVLELHVKALRGGGRVWKFEGRAMVEGELACEATFMAMFDVAKA